MKIAYIALKGFNVTGGIEKYTEEIGSRLSQRNHEIIVYTMRHYGIKENCVYKGMKVKALPSLNTKTLEKLSIALIASMDQLFEKDIDILHFHAIGPSIFSIIPKLLTKRKIIVQSHGLEWKRAKWGSFAKAFLKANEKPLNFLADKLMVVSKVLQKYFRDNYNIESIYTPTGINKQKKLPPKRIKELGLNGNDYIFFACRLVREKGAHHLIKAFNELNPDLKLVIAGDAPHETEYIDKLKEMAQDSKGKIIFTGNVQGDLLYELFSNSYIYVLPSEIEGLPISLLEAMSFGNCCLVSDIEENQEAISGHGFTFENKNTDDLKQKLNMLIGNPKLIEKYKLEAQKHVERHHSWDYIADIIENTYKEILKK